MRTPATRFLDANQVAYALMEYTHDPKTAAFGLEAAEALGLDPDVVFKTLVAQLDPSAAPVVAIVPVAQRLDLRALARVARSKRASMAEVADAERITGYVAGGISPFGQRNQLPTFIDETAVICETIYVSGGRRGLDLGMSPDDLISLLNAVVAPIAT